MHTKKKTCRTYKSHQENVIQFLTQKCVNHNGVLLYHYMGSGKTFTSIGIAINMNLPIVLVAPGGLLSMWKNDYIKPYKHLFSHYSKLKTFSYETLWDYIEKKPDKWFQARILIADEAHNLAFWLSTRLEVKRRNTCLQRLFLFKKRVLLTGTPIYWSEHDLSFLINIVRGKVILPIDANAFKDKFYTVNKKRSLLEGWVAPISNHLFSIVSSTSQISVFSGFMYTQVTSSTFKVIFDLLQKASLGVTTVWYQTLCSALKPFLEPVLMYVTRSKEWSMTLDDWATNKFDHAQETASKNIQKAKHADQQASDIHTELHTKLENEKHQITSGTFFTKRKSLTSTQKKMFQHNTQEADTEYNTQKLMSWGVKNLLGRKENIMLAGQAPYIVLTLLVLFAISVIIKYFYTRESDDELLDLNYKQLVNAMGPYVSYYKPDVDAVKEPNGWWKWFNSRDVQPTPIANDSSTSFPHIKTQLKMVGYNERQTALFIRYTLGKLSFKDYAQLCIIRGEEEGNVTSYNQASSVNFKLYGRMIGNMCSFKASKSVVSGAYMRNIEYNNATHAFTLRTGHTFHSIAPKFKALANKIKLHKKRRVIYSNFNEASATLSAYLNSIHITHKYLRDPPEDDSLYESHDETYSDIMQWMHDAKDGLLIIGQSYSEGLSVKQVDEMHLLEPCETVAKNEQTSGRVARMDSHAPGSTVEIVQWISNLSTMTKWIQSVKNWSIHVPYAWFNDILTNHKQTLTPDAVVYREVHRLSTSTNKVVQLLKKQSIEQYKKTGYPSKCKKNTAKHKLTQVC